MTRRGPQPKTDRPQTKAGGPRSKAGGPRPNAGGPRPKIDPPIAASPRAVAVGAKAAPAAAPRIPAVDALRGLAILAMIAYHFCFDLRHVGLTAWDLYHDAFWLHARTAILSSFLLIAGASVTLANRDGVAPAKFWRHVALIAACACAVSAGSYVLFPESFIWFGVLHAIAVSLVLARPLAARPALAMVIGVLVIAAGNFLADVHFDDRSLGWLGFMTAKPRTEDYVPLFPWMGVLCVGIAAGHALLRTEFRAIAPVARAPAWVARLGRHSLFIYMVHQPILLGILLLATKR
jgi:uncharacterized membrane protein